MTGAREEEEETNSLARSLGLDVSSLGKVWWADPTTPHETHDKLRHLTTNGPMAQFGACSACIRSATVSPNWLSNGVLVMKIYRSVSPQPGNGNGNGNGNGHGNGHASPVHEGVGNLTLIEAAQLIERLQGRAAHERELEALQIARDALLVIVSEGFTSLKERLQTDLQTDLEAAQEPEQEPEPMRALAGGSSARFRAASSPHR